MSDNLTNLNFDGFFECTMWDILQEVSSTSCLCILLGLVIFFGTKWFDSKDVIESLRDESRILKAEVEGLKIIRYDNDLLKNQLELLQENLKKVQADMEERFITMEEGSADLNNKFQRSLSEGIETLIERTKTVECDNRILSKTCDKLAERLSVQEGTVYAIKIMSKEENLSLMDKLHTLESSMKALEHNSGQEIQTLQKAMVNRIEKIEEFLNSDEEEQTVERQILTTPEMG